jgi:hypothetical protein
MSAFQKKAEAQTKQIIGQVLGDGSLVEEGKQEYERAVQGEWRADEKDRGIVREEHGQQRLCSKERRRPVRRAAASHSGR